MRATVLQQGALDYLQFNEVLAIGPSGGYTSPQVLIKVVI
jgi:hypothetical protein